MRGFQSLAEAAKLASPVFHVDKTDPPLLIMHGNRDIQVPINQSYELKEAYDGNGLDVEFIVVPGADHPDPDYYTPKYMSKVKAFLKRTFGN